MENTNQNDVNATESIGVTKMPTEVQNKVSEYKDAWLSHLNDFSKIALKMESADELAQLKSASESMAKVIGIASANFEQRLLEARN